MRRYWFAGFVIIVYAGLVSSAFPSTDITSQQISQQTIRLEISTSDIPLTLNQQEHLENRIGICHSADIDLFNSGVWETLTGGGSRWQMSLEVPESKFISFICNEFYLPPGVELTITDKTGTIAFGPFSYKNNNAERTFSTPPIPGDRIELTLEVPPGVSHPGVLHINAITKGMVDFYHFDDYYKKMNISDDSPCVQVDIRCDIASDWYQASRSVLKIFYPEGWWCSGTLLNNVEEDMVPLIFTDEHCHLGSLDGVQFYFQFENTVCGEFSPLEPHKYITGAYMLASYYNTDFMLLYAKEQIPDSFEPYYAGWSALDSTPNSSVGIHHPGGDYKKIMFEYDSASTTSLRTGVDNTWLTSYDLGYVVPGSSGSPLFDLNKRVVGNLTNFYPCPENEGYYGKFGVSWDHSSQYGEQLNKWLDPNYQGIRLIDGIDGKDIAFSIDTVIGQSTLTVNFQGTADHTYNNWQYYFGDGNIGYTPDMAHTYQAPGIYTITALTLENSTVRKKIKKDMILVHADTLSGDTSSHSAEYRSLCYTISLNNKVPVNEIHIPIDWSGSPYPITLDSLSTTGLRTDFLETKTFMNVDLFYKRATVRLKNPLPSIKNAPIPTGNGPIVKIYFTIQSIPSEEFTIPIEHNDYSVYTTSCFAESFEYRPEITTGEMSVTLAQCCLNLRGNINGDVGDVLDISDLLYFVDYIFAEPPGPAPVCDDEADVNNDGQVDISDVLYLVDYFFLQPAGPAPLDCF